MHHTCTVTVAVPVGYLQYVNVKTVNLLPQHNADMVWPWQSTVGPSVRVRN